MAYVQCMSVDAHSPNREHLYTGPPLASSLLRGYPEAEGADSGR